jgi:hypothetical protein
MVEKEETAKPMSKAEKKEPPQPVPVTGKTEPSLVEEPTKARVLSKEEHMT